MSSPIVIARPLLKEAEAAELLSVEIATLRRWRWAGRPPRFIKIGAAVRYDPADLTALVEAGRRTSTSDPESEAAGNSATRQQYQCVRANMIRDACRNVAVVETATCRGRFAARRRTSPWLLCASLRMSLRIGGK